MAKTWSSMQRYVNRIFSRSYFKQRLTFFSKKSNSTAKTPRLGTVSGRSSGSPPKASPKTAASRNSSRSKKSTSNTPRVSSPLGHPVYVDSAMQTEPDENDPQYVPPKPTRRHEFIPLTKRLLKRCHEDRLRLEEMARMQNSLGSQTDGSAVQPPAVQPASRQNTQEDIEMKDADTAMTPPKSASGATANSPPSGKQPLHSLPSTVAHNLTIPRRPPGNLSVQLPPSQFAHPSSLPPTAASMSPPSLLQTNSLLKSQDMPPPGSSITAPSPIKRKLTFQDYKMMKSCGSLTTPTKESQPHIPIVSQTPGSSADGSPQTAKSVESQKQPDSPTTPDTAMKDVQMSNAPADVSPLLGRDPRLQSGT